MHKTPVLKDFLKGIKKGEELVATPSPAIGCGAQIFPISLNIKLNEIGIPPSSKNIIMKRRKTDDLAGFSILIFRLKPASRFPSNVMREKRGRLLVTSSTFP